MFEIVDTQGQEAVIKVIGVGGCGGNAVDHMIAKGVQGVEFARTKKGNGYGVNPDQLIIATIKNGKFAFAGYLKDSLEKVGLTPAVIEQLMKEESILSD